MLRHQEAHQNSHRGYHVELLQDAAGTLDIANKAGSVTVGELDEAILVAGADVY